MTSLQNQVQQLYHSEKQTGIRNISQRRRLNRKIRLLQGGEGEETDKYKFELEHKPSYGTLELKIPKGAKILAEPGAMVYMQHMETETKRQGGLFKSLAKKMLGGESFFYNTYTSTNDNAVLALAPTLPGDVDSFQITKGQNLFLQGGAFLACDPEVDIDTKFQGFKGFFSGESVFFLRLSVKEDAPKDTYQTFFNSYGAIEKIEIDANENEPFVIDTGHIVAFDDKVTYKIGKAGGFKSFLFGGEGLVMNFTGKGTVWIQTRNLQSLASVLIPLWPKPK